jgi:SAM-dependent methyltransferase
VDAKETPVPATGKAFEPRSFGPTSLEPSTLEPDWFARWFGEDYKRLYPHRDEAQASGQVDSLLRAAAAFSPELSPEVRDVRNDPRVLDVGCGSGRHLRAFRARGLAAFGIDLSSVLLKDARRDAHGIESPVARADMRRLPFGDDRFDLATCFFTTFGYFDSHEEDVGFLRELRRVVRPSGLLFLDLPNPVVVRRDLVPSERVERDGLRAEVSRRIEGDRVIKRIRIFRDGADREDSRAEIHEERVRLYTRDDLGVSLGRLGLAILATFGDERGAAFEPETSPRMSLLLRRNP